MPFMNLRIFTLLLTVKFEVEQYANIRRTCKKEKHDNNESSSDANLIFVDHDHMS